MSALPLDEAISFRPAPDSRPPAFEVEPVRSESPALAQPPLPFAGPPDAARTSSAGPADGLVTPVLAANQWSATLALAVFEALHGRRPVGQLTRWVDDRVHAAIAYHRRRAGTASPGRPARLRSVRVQHPRPDAAEVCAHLVLDGRSYALALRLDVWGDRWLCTGIAFG